MKKEKFSKKVIGDEDAIYMSCPEEISKHLAQRLSSYKTAVELCCALGITVIQLAQKMDKVYGVDISEDRIKSAVENSKIYGVNEKVEFVVGDVLSDALLKSIKAEVAILDPDWSNYGNDKSNHVDSLEMTQPNMRELFYKVKNNITDNIVMRIPKTFTFDTLAKLGKCRIENIIWDERIRFKYAYFLSTITENEEIDCVFDL